MFCPGCGTPHSKSERTCSECERDLTIKPQGHLSSAQRNVAERLLIARTEAALLRIPKQKAGETDLAFIERTVQARTKQLADQARAMTFSGIGGHA